MATHAIPLDAFTAHGKLGLHIDDGILHMTGGADRGAFADIPYKFRLPFRIDMTVKMDAPAFILRVGAGYINFNSGGMDNRRMMTIIGGETKPNIHKFDNWLPLNEPCHITVIYGRNAMQLIANGEERYFSKKDAYMKSPSIDTDFPDFGIGIACLKRTEVEIMSLTVTEYDNEPDFAVLPKKAHAYIPALTPVPHAALDDCIKDLSPALQDCMRDMDKRLKSAKFRRKIEGGYPNSKITYVLSKVISYQVKISYELLTHRTMVLSENTIANFNAIFLDRLAAGDSDLAGEIFYRMNTSTCTHCMGPGCHNFNRTEYQGSVINNCALTVHFKMIPSDFDDARRVIDTVLAMQGLAD